MGLITNFGELMYFFKLKHIFALSVNIYFYNFSSNICT